MKVLSIILLLCLAGSMICNPALSKQVARAHATPGLAGITCGESEKHEIVKHKERPLPSPTPGKALVFIGFGSHFGKGYQHKVTLDQRWVAVLNKSQYTFFEVQPGVQRFGYNLGSMREGGVTFDLTTQADHTYYLRATLGDFFELNETEGKLFMSKLDYVTFEVKGSQPEEWWTQRAKKFEEGWPRLKNGMSINDVSAMLGIELPATGSDVPQGQGYRLTLGVCGHGLQFTNGLLTAWK